MKRLLALDYRLKIVLFAYLNESICLMWSQTQKLVSMDKLFFFKVTQILVHISGGYNRWLPSDQHNHSKSSFFKHCSPGLLAMQCDDCLLKTLNRAHSPLTNPP